MPRLTSATFVPLLPPLLSAKRTYSQKYSKHMRHLDSDPPNPRDQRTGTRTVRASPSQPTALPVLPRTLIMEVAQPAASSQQRRP
ncbi:hypothetical protein GGR56DRAFT_612271 [Xylariaceae sp. FL0804]|nr:hypothetical protein GGR56DRAFT_612271 [Xylariaceae sp. FL0804]